MNLPITENAAGTSARLLTLTDIQPEQGYCARARLPAWVGRGDNEENPQTAVLRLFEDGQEIGPGHALHAHIRDNGRGRYSHWEGTLFFSASDGSDPMTNGRHYQVLVPPPGLISTLYGLLAGSEMTSLSQAERHQILTRMVKVINPAFILPDHGRRLEEDDPFRTAFYRFFPTHTNTMDRKYAVWQLAQLAAALPGEMAEVGCYTGATAWFLAERLAQANKGHTLHLFDSFTGLSKPGDRDGDYWKEGALSASEDIVRQNLAPFPFVHLHAGWVPDRFAEVAEKRFSLVHIDVDLYQPTRDSAAFFYERLVPGGLMICDDYGFNTCPGATAAFDEVLAGKPEPIINLPTGGAYIIKC